MVYIRKAIIEDVADIGRILSQMSPRVPDNIWLLKDKFKLIRDNPDYNLFVATDHGIGDKIIGIAMMHFQHKFSYNCGTAAHLEDVVVDEPYRHLHVGTQLIKHAIEIAKNNNCYKIMLNCHDGNLSFYEKLGFSRHDNGMKMILENK